MDYIRAKLRFALLRGTLVAIQGFRGKGTDANLKISQILT